MILLKDNPKPLQEIFSLNVGNAAGRGVPTVLTPMIVTRVGRKYFYICEKDEFEIKAKTGRDLNEIAFHLGTWRQKTNYSARHELYLDEQSRLDEVEGDHLSNKIHKYFEYGRNSKSLPLEALRKIDCILNANIK